MHEALEDKERISKLEGEVHWVKESIPKIFEKIDGIIAAMSGKPISIPAIIGMIAGGISILAGMFIAVIFIAGSQTAPIESQSKQLALAIQNQGSQITTAIQAMQSNMMQNTNLIQLTNKEVSVNGAKTKENEGTLQWLIFEENIPKQVTVLQQQIKALQKISHIHSSMAIPIK